MSNSFFTHPQQIASFWTKAYEQQLDRMATVTADLDKKQTEGLERGQQAIDDSAKLVKDSVVQAGELASEWRQWWLSAARRSMDLATPGE